MDLRAKHGPAKRHITMKMVLQRNQALVITTTAETLMARTQSGATPPILRSGGTIVKGSNKQNKQSPRNSPAKEKTTEEYRTKPDLDASAKHGPANLRNSIKQHLRCTQTQA